MISSSTFESDQYSLFISGIYLYREDQYDILSVCDWGQKLSFYQLNGKQVRDCNAIVYSKNVSISTI